MNRLEQMEKEWQQNRLQLNPSDNPPSHESVVTHLMEWEELCQNRIILDEKRMIAEMQIKRFDAVNSPRQKKELNKWQEKLETLREVNPRVVYWLGIFSNYTVMPFIKQKEDFTKDDIFNLVAEWEPPVF